MYAFLCKGKILEICLYNFEPSYMSFWEKSIMGWIQHKTVKLLLKKKNLSFFYDIYE
jgi:hypothetical protein